MIDKVINPIHQLGKQTIAIISELGQLGTFLFFSIVQMFTLPLQIFKFIQQIYFVGMKSVMVICLTGLSTGMVLGFQGYYTLVKFGSEGLLGAAVALSLIREMGPVLTAIMVTGRAGSAMAAEMGLNRMSEQIDALETMDINPIRFLVSPRLLASLISFPLLTAIFDVVGIIGGFLTGSALLGINPGVYFARIESSVVMRDVTGGFIKSLVFAVIVAVICCYQGYYAHTRKEGFGAKGVSMATTSAVVISCVLILLSDYVITSFLM